MLLKSSPTVAYLAMIGLSLFLGGCNQCGRKLATVEVEGNMELVRLEEGAMLWVNNGNYCWKAIPAAFEGFVFTQFDKLH